MHSRTTAPIKVAVTIGALLVGVVFIVPVLWLILASLMTKREITSVPQVYVPAAPQFENYVSFFQQGVISNVATGEVASGLVNSLIVAFSVTALNLLFGTMTAYSLARARFRGRHSLLIFYLATRMLPTVSLMIPLYLLFRSIGLLDSKIGLIIAYLPYTLPFTIWMLTTYFRLIPPELDDAALVDGANRWQALVWVVAPVAMPALISAGIFAFVSCWSEFLLAVILTRSAAAETITVAAANFSSDIYINYNLVAATGVLAIIPPVLLTLAFQRHITSGLGAGAVK